MSKRVLREKPRVSYYEPDEPPLDEYVFCDECGDFVFEYCSLHGALLVIPDNKVLSKSNLPSYVPKAALTIPNVFLHIAPSIIPEAGLGIFATLSLPKGVRFGPYRGNKTDQITSTYCWQIYDKEHKASHVVDAIDANNSNWMRYVNCSRHWSEQNLVAYQYQGQIYYRTIKVIPRFTELMVFYGSEFANLLNVDLYRYNAPPGYAQKFGAPPVKKRKINTTKTEKQPEVKNFKVKNNSNDSVNQETLQKKTKKLTNKSNKKIKENVQNKSTKNAIKIGLANQSKAKPIIKTTEPKITKEFKDIYKYCSVCNHKCITENDLAKHMRFHDSNRKFACEICNKNFQWKTVLEKHLLKHANIKRYSCNVCDFKTKYNTSLKLHNKIHTGEKPFVCDICKYKFTYKSSLVTHQRIHSGEKPFVCDICNNKFTEKSTLVKHKRIHTGEKLFSCVNCNYKCNFKSSLKQHLKIHA